MTKFFFLTRRGHRGWEATAVRGIPGAKLCTKRPSGFLRRRLRCFNCGNVTRHLAADCPKPKLPKRCHHCKVSPKKYHGAKPAAVFPPSASNHQKTRYIFRGSLQPTSFLFLRGSEHRKHFEGLFLVCSSIAHILVYLCIFIFKSMFHLLTSQYFNNLDLFLLPIIAIICDLTILIVFPCFSRRII